MIPSAANAHHALQLTLVPSKRTRDPQFRFFTVSVQLHNRRASADVELSVSRWTSFAVWEKDEDYAVGTIRRHRVAVMASFGACV